MYRQGPRGHKYPSDHGGTCLPSPRVPPDVDPVMPPVPERQTPSSTRLRPFSNIHSWYLLAPSITCVGVRDAFLPETAPSTTPRLFLWCPRAPFCAYRVPAYPSNCRSTNMPPRYPLGTRKPRPVAVLLFLISAAT
ncbi:uncharacterized protein SETTUDRAFT_168773 [Exserohilum turcica Et28A]|uniref:Uncharacterized protein n=1 Tax=Exserohilum turcicum (strain 28A) TaxID=671987 RepID=R0ITL0_EXST2|nr:uncharacterized protein SETTUDRAFT_168773 [Exserohilum turcica Et28A]EOA87981.1 hypothetical protein SETTUDRAFT_168773 [Exserohilum turcica Et28A]